MSWPGTDETPQELEQRMSDEKTPRPLFVAEDATTILSTYPEGRFKEAVITIDAANAKLAPLVEALEQWCAEYELEERLCTTPAHPLSAKLYAAHRKLREGK